MKKLIIALLLSFGTLHAVASPDEPMQEAATTAPQIVSTGPITAPAPACKISIFYDSKTPESTYITMADWSDHCILAADRALVEVLAAFIRERDLRRVQQPPKD